MVSFQRIVNLRTQLHYVMVLLVLADKTLHFVTVVRKEKSCSWKGKHSLVCSSWLRTLPASSLKQNMLVVDRQSNCLDSKV
jgi:hypothetical protein